MRADVPEVRIEIHHRTGIEIYDDFNINFAVLDGHPRWPTTETPSLLSGGPSVKYKTLQATIDLTPTEIYRLTMRCLSPIEFFKLKKAAPGMREIREAFYDPKSGTAVQPRA